jgi:hypothetical protein
MLAESVHPPVTAATRHVAPIERLAGTGGLLFVTLLIIQNVVRASGPSFTATPATVAAYFADHRAAALIPLGLFPVGMLAILCFAAGIWTRSHETESRWWATVGTLAVVVLAGLFSLVNIIEIAIAAKGSELVTSPDVVQALWTVHAAAFGLNLAAIALAMLGLSRAALAAGLIPGLLAVAVLPGAACLFIAAIFTVAIAGGGQWLYLGYLGFAIWGIFLVVAGTALVRGRPARSPADV